MSDAIESFDSEIHAQAGTDLQTGGAHIDHLHQQSGTPVKLHETHIERRGRVKLQPIGAEGGDLGELFCQAVWALRILGAAVDALGQARKLRLSALLALAPYKPQHLIGGAVLLRQRGLDLVF
jgi:hypothetical protein